MSLPTIEIAYGTATEVARSNAQVFDPAAAILKQQDGLLRLYHGIQHEDQKTVYAVVAWESIEHHQRFVDNSEVFSEFLKHDAAVFDMASGPPNVIHMRPTSDPYASLDAPVVELVFWTLLHGKFDDQVKAGFEEFFNKVDAHSRGKPGYVGSCWGPAVEKDNVIVSFVGWSSVQAHIDLVNSEPEKAAEVIGKMKAIATTDLCHVPLTAI